MEELLEVEEFLICFFCACNFGRHLLELPGIVYEKAFFYQQVNKKASVHRMHCLNRFSAESV